MYVVDERKLSWIRLILKVRGSVLPRIWRRISVVTGVALAITAVHETIFKVTISLTTTPFVLIGLPLGIFLGFRNSASYDRFWEGRKLWGGLVNTSRSVARQLITFVRPQEEGRPTKLDAEQTDEMKKVHRELVNYWLAFVHTLRMSLRNEPPYERLNTLMPHEEVDSLRAEKNLPAAIIHRLGLRLMDERSRGWVHPLHAPMLDASLSAAIDIQGGCERIKNTPLPFSYIVLIHRIVAFYCLFLPLGLVDTLHWYTPIAVLMVSYALFGLDAIGDEIENPFGTDVNDLPLLAISRTIEINMRQQLGDKELPPPIVPKHDILL
ncbi:MAG: bestrophin family protein [Polyangiaceae bacterium]